MKRLMIAAAAVALLAGVGAASARSSHHKGYYGSEGGFTNRNVRLQSEPDVPPPNADLKYGPQPYYPQSPPSGGP